MCLFENFLQYIRPLLVHPKHLHDLVADPILIPVDAEVAPVIARIAELVERQLEVDHLDPDAIDGEHEFSSMESFSTESNERNQ